MSNDTRPNANQTTAKIVHSRAFPPEAVEYLERFMDTLPTLFVELDTQGRVRRANDAASKLLGHSRDQLIGMDWYATCVPERDRERLRGVHSTLVTPPHAGMTSHEGTILGADGAEHVISWTNSVLIDDQDRALGTASTGVDITEQVRADRELRDMKHALDSSAIVAITDTAGIITYANSKFCEISKYAPEELLGKTHRVINAAHHSKTFFRELWETIEAGKVWSGDIKNRAKDGSHYWVATTIVPFLDEKGVPYQYLAIRTEITQRKTAEQALERAVQKFEEVSERERTRAEDLEAAHTLLQEAHGKLTTEQQKLLQAEKLSSIGLLSAGVAHEVNNPLAGIRACLDNLRKGDLPQERAEQYFDAVADGLDRIAAIVQGLLDYARPMTGTPTRLDLGEVLEACLVLMAATVRKQRVTIEQNVRKGEVFAIVDRSQFMQATINVILNAVQASEPGGRLIIEGGSQNDRTWVTFQDFGSGMPKEIVHRVCDPFFTTKEQGEGTGLGLSVTLGILQAHDGDLEIDSVPGQGTTMRLTLPEGSLQEEAEKE